MIQTTLSCGISSTTRDGGEDKAEGEDAFQKITGTFFFKQLSDRRPDVYPLSELAPWRWGSELPEEFKLVTRVGSVPP